MCRAFVRIHGNINPMPFAGVAQVMRFWDKANRVLGYKQQTLVAASKKVVLDKHLDFLVGQTQRYSTLLAERLAGEAAIPGNTGGISPLLSLPAPEVRILSPSHDSVPVCKVQLHHSSWICKAGCLSALSTSMHAVVLVDIS